MPQIRERIRKTVDREPFWRKIEDRMDRQSSRIRNKPGTALKKRVPSLENRNIGGGLAVGVVEAAVAVILRRTIGLPFGSDVEIVDTEPSGAGVIYTINVDAPSQNMAEAEAFFEAGTGFTSLLTDLIAIRNAEVIKHRVLRDTYQIEVMVED